MKRILFSVLLILAIAVSACTGSDSGAAQKASAKISGSKMKADWIKFDAGIAKSAKEKKHMIVDFYTDWCHWCKVMDEKTFSNDEINQKLRDKFVTVRLEAENANETATFKGQTYSNVELTRAFGVTGFPSLAFLNSDGEVITIVPGYVPPETFTYILDYIDQECYKKQISFDEFMKKKGECEDKSKT